jgi:hypothetical protein
MTLIEGKREREAERRSGRGEEEALNVGGRDSKRRRRRRERKLTPSPPTREPSALGAWVSVKSRGREENGRKSLSHRICRGTFCIPTKGGFSAH